MRGFLNVIKTSILTTLKKWAIFFCYVILILFRPNYSCSKYLTFKNYSWLWGVQEILRMKPSVLKIHFLIEIELNYLITINQLQSFNIYKTFNSAYIKENILPNYVNLKLL